MELVEIADTLAFKLNTPAPRQFFNKLIEDTLEDENCFVTLSGVVSTTLAFDDSGSTAISITILMSSLFVPPLFERFVLKAVCLASDDG